MKMIALLLLFALASIELSHATPVLDMPLKIVSATKPKSRFSRKPVPFIERHEVDQLLVKVNSLLEVCHIRTRVESYQVIHFEKDEDPTDKLHELARYKEFGPITRVTFFSTSGYGYSSDSGAGLTALGAASFGEDVQVFRSKSAHVVAHELMHHLGLTHDKDPKNLMYEVTLKSAEKLTPQQCEKSYHNLLVFLGLSNKPLLKPVYYFYF